jgi:hypothetical protein
MKPDRWTLLPEEERARREPWVRLWAFLLGDAIGRGHDFISWKFAVAESEERLDGLVGSSYWLLDTLAHLSFVLSYVEANAAVEDKFNPVGGYILQLAFDQEEFEQYVQSGKAPTNFMSSRFSRDFQPERHSGEPLESIFTFPEFRIWGLMNRSPSGAPTMRALFDIIRGRVENLVDRVRQAETSIASWKKDRERLEIALRTHFLLPVTTDLGVIDGEFTPMAKFAFAPEALNDLRRQDAVFSEYHAYLAETLINDDLPSFENLDKVLLRRSKSAFEARQRLRRLRSRLAVPSTVFKEVDERLKRPSVHS